MTHSIYMNYEVKVCGHIIVVDAYGVAQDDSINATEEVLNRLYSMIRKSYSNADSINLKRVMVKNDEDSPNKCQ